MQGGHSRAGLRARTGAFASMLLACALALAAFASTASAGTIAVTNLNDSGVGSLRDAIAKAEAGETITVPAGQITLTSAPLQFEKNLTIDGAGSGATTISGGDTWRVFTIKGTPTVKLAGLTIAHGKSSTGAGISATGELTLENVVVSGNHAGGAGVDGFGGGIAFGGSILTLTESVVSENTAGGGVEAAGFGGGIEYEPTAPAQTFTLTLTRSRVTGNRAGNGKESSGFGAGIDASTGAEHGAISIGLIESVVSGNVAGGGVESLGFGAGIELESGGKNNALALTLTGSAVTGNTAGGGEKSPGFGGGIDFSSGGTGVTQTLTATNSTISANTAGGGMGAAGNGGGLLFGAGTATLSYMTIAGNTAGGGGGAAFGAGLDIGSAGAGGIGSSIVAANSGGNCATAVPSLGHNVDDGTSCGFKGAGDRSGVDARLGPLGEHGGLSPTLMPLAGSPAIDAGDPATCPTSDQRGVARPQAGGCDVGAVEVAPPAVTTGAASAVGDSAATVSGTVTPQFSATSYHVDFGTTTAYGNFTGQVSAGEGGAAQAVSAALTKLKAQTVYHYRIVASNAAGTVVGGDRALTTAKAPIVPPKKSKPLARPTLSAVSMTNRRFRVGRQATAISATAVAARRAPLGTRFRLRLSVSANVQIAFTRSVGGLRRGRSCVAPTRKLRRAHAKRCTRTLAVGRLTRAKVRAGASAIAFSGRLGRKPLPPGNYRATLSASNGSARSNVVALGFSIVR